MTRTFTRGIAFLSLCALLAPFCRAQSPPILSCSANVLNYGATGNGATYDTNAINNAILAVSGSAIANGSPGLVYFPPGTYLVNTVHLQSDTTLWLASGCTLLCGTDLDTRDYYPNDSPWTSYQDFGHSYFKDAMITGSQCYNIGIEGPGVMTGNGRLSTGVNSESQYTLGEGDKVLSLVQCTNITLEDATITKSGHFGILAQSCTNMYMNNFYIYSGNSSNSRDAFDLIGGVHCYIYNSVIQGSDDAMCLKSTYALGYAPPSYDIRVDHCWILSTENNATQFGSETVGNFTDIMFTNLLLTSAGKAGIGITMNDGATIDGVTYCGITETNCAGPIFMKLSYRGSGAPGPPPVGHIRNISINDVTSSHASYFGHSHASGIFGYGPSSGTPAGNVQVQNVVLNNVVVTNTGGAPVSQASDYVADNTGYTPQNMDPYPAYGWQLRHVNGIAFMGSSGTTPGWTPNFVGMSGSVAGISGTVAGWVGPVPDYTTTDCETHLDSPDGRPAFKDDNDGANVKIDDMLADVNLSGTLNSPYDMGYYSVTGYNQTNCTGTTPAAFTPAAQSGTMVLRVSSSSSSASSICFPPTFSPLTGNYSSAQTVTLSCQTPGVTIRYTTDDSTPTETNGTIYTGPFIVTSDVAIRAIAYESGYSDSAVNTSIYYMTWLAPTPAFEPAGGSYPGSQQVQITSLATLVNNGSIRYTTDGSTPTETNGALYTGPITVSGNETIQAIAYGPGVADSYISSATYSFADPNVTAGAPAMSPAGGAYAGGQSVTLSSTSPGASINYTTDGSTPTETNGALYTGPVVINTSGTLQAMAFGSGYNDSSVSSGAYVINSSTDYGTVTLTATTSGTNAPEVEQSDSTIGSWEALEATGTGQWIEYTIKGLPAGTYDFRMEWKGNTERGILQEYLDGTLLSGSSWEFSGGTATYPVSNTLDQYTNGQSYWYTDYGPVTVTGTGNHIIKQEVVGKDAANNSAPWLSAAQFYFNAIPPAVSSIPNQTIEINTSTGSLPFTINNGSGAASGLTVTASSSDTSYIPVNGITLGGSGTNMTISVTPAADQVGTGMVTVNVAGQGAVANTSFTVTGTASQVESWRLQYFGTNANSGSSADTADPMNDGIPNLEKYVLNLDPTQSDVAPFVTGLIGSNFTFTYTRSDAALANVTVTCQWATSIAGPWSSSGVTEQILNDDGTVQTVQDSVSPNGATSVFFRLQITDP
jgi:hypothetical protein